MLASIPSKFQDLVFDLAKQVFDQKVTRRFDRKGNKKCHEKMTAFCTVKLYSLSFFG